MVKETVKRLAQGTALYSPLKDSYHFLFNRNHWRYRQESHRFYRQFFPKGSLVFDVGANVGLYTEMFLKLGARVLAVEPNPQCVTRLRMIRPANRLVIEPTAVGNAVGEATLYDCGDSRLSTLSPEWIRVAGGTQRFGQMHWRDERVVPVTTLDALIAKYGTPAYIKIDVEGFEKRVLSGLSKAPAYVSFEVNTEYIEVAIDCVSSPCFSRAATFNIIIADAPRYELKDWVTKNRMVEILSSREIKCAETNGDLFVREG